jgi:hypothetical protein
MCHACVCGRGEERRENCTRFWCESLKERDHSEDRSVDRRMGLQLILGRLNGGCSGFSWLRIGGVGDSYEHGDERSGSGPTELLI